MEAAVINGFAPSFKNTTVKLFFTEDFFSHAASVKSSTTTNDSGYFKFEIQNTQTEYIYLKIAKCKMDFYIQPDGNYKLFVDKPLENDLTLFNRDINVNFGLIPDKRQDINILVKAVNAEIDSFFTINYKYFLIKSARIKTDSFRIKLLSKYQHIPDYYFKQHLKYSLASLDIGAYHSNKFLSENYLTQPLNYRLPEYADFIRDAFKGQMIEFAESKNGAGMLELINQNANCRGAYEKFKKYANITNDTLCELIFINELYNYYYAPDCIKKNVLLCLENMQALCLAEKNRLIVKNLHRHLTRYFKGTAAPDFTLLDNKQKSVSLKDFKGKTLIIAFGASWSDEFISELKVLEHHKLGRKIAILAVSTENNTDVLKEQWKKNKFDFALCSFVTQPEILEAYDVKAIPQFYVINKDGLFIEAPAQLPSKMAPAYFEAMKKLK